ncbi:hypothetical protein FNL56_16320 [Tardiphaga sp. vice304]|uniref:hypothetical protein n=1 Tax=Tardiphaga sp. vice304 TaxID=2592817 RepID=UPI00116308C1|nr:hypothetical protein [Tardiphaga sp. vice304]QDM27511.1 hypothetical protein FNL56_16320 [Tardiphaga sp. vice304]
MTNIHDVTVLHLTTGNIKTMDYDRAHKLIAFGEWIETVPEDAERAKEWRAALRERVTAEAKLQNIDMKPFDAYAAWCEAAGLPVLPASEGQIVLYLLQLHRDGMPQHEVRYLQRYITVVHDFAKHPPRHMLKTVWNAFMRALVYAKAALRDDVQLLDMPQAVPGKAIDMFPDGKVPLRWNDVAA